MRFAVLASFLLVAPIIACSVEKAPEGSSEDPTITLEMTPLELGCVGEGTSFQVAPASRRLEGKLTVGTSTTSFVCTQPASDPAGNAALVVTCAEQAQTVHPGAWKVDVTKDGPVFRATVLKGDGDDQTMFCATPVKPGDSVPSFADAKLVIDGTCHGCHRNGTFGTIEKIKAKRAMMIERVSNREMPRNDPKWLDTPEAKTLLDFLQKSAELN
jgi:hypothetical protein